MAATLDPGAADRDMRAMCGRFALVATPEEIEELLALLDLEPFPPRYNIAPTQPILIVAAGNARREGSNLPERRALLARWGLIPSWKKDPNELPLLFNARSEGVAEKASFRAAMMRRRVLVPASGFYEWRKLGKGRSQAYWVRPRHGGLVAFAGLMETWMEPGGSELDTAAILTTAANPTLRFIHERMPVVIMPEDFERWLDCRSHQPRDVADLLRPADPEFFEAVPVSDKVGKVENVGPDLLQPVAVETASAPAAAAPGQMSLF